MKGRAGVVVGTVVALAAAAPATAREPSETASCVAWFVLPQAHAGAFGETVRTFPELFFPLGQSVSVQARAPRDACPFSPPE